LAWNSLKNNRRVKTCCATGASGTMTLTAGTTTIIPLTDFHACTDNSLFKITDNGAIRITEGGRYLFAAGVYNYGSCTSFGLDIAYTTTLNATTGLHRLYSAQYQNTNGSGGGFALPAKAVYLSEPVDIYLRTWGNGASNNVYPDNNSTFLSIVKLGN